MRIFFATKTLAANAGGAERVLKTVAEGLAGRGHSVAIASFDAPDTSDFYPLRSEIDRLRLGIGAVSRRTSKREGVARMLGLRRAARDFEADVAVGFLHSAYLPLGAAMLGADVPVVASEHIVYQYYDDRPLERAALNLAPWLVDAMTAVSEQARATYPRRLQRIMRVLPNPVEPAASRPRATHAGHTLLSVGRLTAQKDQATLLDAFARIMRRFPSWKLAIVGEGELRPQLEAQIRALDMGDRVSLPGLSKDIDAVYAGADLFVLPSRYESLGLVTAEALAHGLPAVGFADCPGTNVLIQHEVNGLLVEPTERPAMLAAALERLMGDAPLRSRLAAAAPSSVAHMAPELVVEQWEALLRSACRPRR